jgi:uncharacterized glyoxalase superfamily protein PhnB
MRQTVTPYLLYEDADGALEWLAKAFGFREQDRGSRRPPLVLRDPA